MFNDCLCWAFPSIFDNKTLKFCVYSLFFFFFFWFFRFFYVNLPKNKLVLFYKRLATNINNLLLLLEVSALWRVILTIFFTLKLSAINFVVTLFFCLC